MSRHAKCLVDTNLSLRTDFLGHIDLRLGIEHKRADQCHGNDKQFLHGFIYSLLIINYFSKLIISSTICSSSNLLSDKSWLTS